jgi:hypothetical protein
MLLSLAFALCRFGCRQHRRRRRKQKKSIEIESATASGASDDRALGAGKPDADHHGRAVTLLRCIPDRSLSVQLL